MKNKEEIICPICSSNNIKEFYKYNEFKLFKCDSCELVFQSDMKGCNIEQVISEVYDDNWVNMRDQYSENTFLQHSIFNTLLLNLFCEKKGLLLEIGSGTGEFLHSARSDGWDVVGIEPSKNSCTYAKDKYNIDISNDIWNLNLIEENTKFDVVVFWHVFEHIMEPKKFLDEISTILNDSGLVFFSIPNNNSFTNKVYGSNSPIYKEKDHFYHYSEKNLKLLLSQSGLEIIKMFSREEFERLNQDIRAYSHIKKQYTDLSIKDKVELKNNLENNFEGHEIFCICKKTSIKK